MNKQTVAVAIVLAVFIIVQSYQVIGGSWEPVPVHLKNLDNSITRSIRFLEVQQELVAKKIHVNGYLTDCGGYAGDDCVGCKCTCQDEQNSALSCPYKFEPPSGISCASYNNQFCVMDCEVKEEALIFTP